MRPMRLSIASDVGNQRHGNKGHRGVGIVASIVATVVVSTNEEDSEVQANGHSGEEAGVDNPPKAKKTRLSTDLESENARGSIPPGNLTSDLKKR